MAAGKCRQNQYDTIGTVTLRIPPLRERRKDIVPLIDHLPENIFRKSNRRTETR
jgi:two-component system response regulator AtoC